MVVIYCDGAASNNGYDNAVGGYGWVMELRGEAPLLYGGRKENATNNQMELTAMISALSFLEGMLSRGEYKLEDDEQVFVYTDSAYISNCYTQKWYLNWRHNGWVNSKREPVANKESWETLIPWFERPNIHIVKVKGHSTNLGNQIADKLAVAARTMDTLEFSKYKYDFSKELQEIWGNVNDRLNNTSI